MQTKVVTLINGQASHGISVEDRGLAYGDGLFETMRWQDGEIPLLEYHLARLLGGCKRLGLPLAPQTLNDQLTKLLTLATGSATSTEVSDVSSHTPHIAKVKIIVTRGQLGRGCYSSELIGQGASSVNVVLVFSPLALSVNGRAGLVTAKYALEENSQLVGLKHLNRLNYIVASMDSSLNDNQELLYLDHTGAVVETMHHNVFMVKKGKIYTPQLKNAGVAGVMRSVLAENVFANTLPYCATRITLDQLQHADEVFISNALSGITSIAQVDNKKIKQGSESVTQSVEKHVTRLFSKARITKLASSSFGAEYTEGCIDE